MADILHVKTKSKWKDVDLSTIFASKGDFDGLISFQELTDYEILNEANKKRGKKIKKKEKKRTVLSEDQQSQPDEKADSNVTRQLKKKKKEKKMKNATPDDNKRVNSEQKQKKKSKKLKKSNLSLPIPCDLNMEMLHQDELTGEKQKEKQVKQKKRKRKLEAVKEEKGLPKKKRKLEQASSAKVVELPADKSLEGMESWKDLYVPPEILWALRDLGFKEPTPIQQQVLASAIRDKMDIVGAAETGSGKTLAFGIPILHFILEEKNRKAKPSETDLEVDSGNETGPEHLNSDDLDIKDECDNAADDADDVVEQVKDEMSNDDNDDDSESEYTENNNDSDKGDGKFIDDFGEDGDDDDGDESIEGSDNFNKTDAVVRDNDKSGVAEKDDSTSEEELEELQEDGTGCVKVIKDVDFSWLDAQTDPDSSQTGNKPVVSYPPALILEPTRELAIQVKNHLQAAAKYTDVKIATIVGGLSLQKQRRILNRCPDVIVATPGRLWELVQEGEVYFSEVEKTRYVVIDEADRMIEKGHFEELSMLLEKLKRNRENVKRHTYVFSATLTMVHSGPQRIMKKRKKKIDEKQKLMYLMRKMGLQPKPKVVDITRKIGTVETLTEAKINCTKEEKDIYLYYFLKQYPGRTLVFTNSKDCIRRLVSIFTLLQCEPLPLHADMHQRQRLKNLDKFTGNAKGLLIASDVAARGLDIPNVQHVIHYQVPHTVENYVHRSGRTARALKEGLSVMIISPEDLKNYRKIIHTLNRDEELPMFPMEQDYLPEISRRVNLVREIETQEYRFNKKKRQNDWFRKAAEEIGVDIEDEGLLDDLGDDVDQHRQKQHLKQMKHELSILLKQPVHTKSTFSKYPTKSGRLVTLPVKDKVENALEKVKKVKSAETTKADSSEEPQQLTRSQKRRQQRREKWKKRRENQAE